MGWSHKTHNMRSSENTRSSSIGSGGKFWSIPLPPGPLTNSSMVLQRTLLSSQYNNNTANLGCAGFPSMRLAVEQVRGLRLVLLDDATQMLPSELPTGKGRQYQGLSCADMTSQDKYLLLPGKPESQLVEPSYSFLMPECKQATSGRLHLGIGGLECTCHSHSSP